MLHEYRKKPFVSLFEDKVEAKNFEAQIYNETCISPSGGRVIGKFQNFTKELSGVIASAAKQSFLQHQFLLVPYCKGEKIASSLSSLRNDSVRAFPYDDKIKHTLAFYILTTAPIRSETKSIVLLWSFGSLGFAPSFSVREDNGYGGCTVGAAYDFPVRLAFV